MFQAKQCNYIPLMLCSEADFRWRYCLVIKTPTRFHKGSLSLSLSSKLQ